MAKIRSRKSWGARAPRPRSRQSVRNVRELFFHWPGSVPRSYGSISTVAEEEKWMRDIQSFHMGPSRGWSDFAYSFAIFPSGRIYRGRGSGYVPAAQEGHNTNTIAVCFVLGPDDKITPEMEKAARQLRREMERKAGHKLRVRGHGEVYGTECPGPRLRGLVRELN